MSDVAGGVLIDSCMHLINYSVTATCPTGLAGGQNIKSHVGVGPFCSPEHRIVSEAASVRLLILPL